MSTEKLGIWERQMVVMMEDLWSLCYAAQQDCGQIQCLKLAAFLRRNRGEKQKDPFGHSRLLQHLAWVQLRVCFPILRQPLMRETSCSMMYGRFPERWLTALTCGIPVSREALKLSTPWLERSRTSFLGKATVFLGIRTFLIFLAAAKSSKGKGYEEGAFFLRNS